jgi:hypothetical protein
VRQVLKAFAALEMTALQSSLPAERMVPIWRPSMGDTALSRSPLQGSQFPVPAPACSSNKPNGFRIDSIAVNLQKS